MSTLAHACGDAAQCKLGRLQLQVHDFNTISRASPGLEAPNVRQAAQRALKGEVRACLGETVNLRQYRASCGNKRQLRLQRREVELVAGRELKPPTRGFSGRFRGF